MAKAKTQILRYPYESLSDITDYFQINLVSRQTRRDGKSGASSESFKKVNTKITFNNKLTPDFKLGEVTNSLTNSVVTTDGIIILPMPSSIVDTNQVNYSDDSLDAITATVAELAGGLMQTKLFDANGKNFDLSGALTRAKNTLNQTLNETNLKDVKDLILANLAAQAGSLVGLTNLSLNQVLARSTGEIVNPNMELLFNGPTIRNFSFSFKLTPRDEKEAEQIKLIIRSLKKHMSPRNNQGLFLSSPHVFELRYKQGLKDHQYLHRFKRCALQNMSVNYTGENVYATYDDGAPVSTILSLSFKELEPIYAEDYVDDTKENRTRQENPFKEENHGGVGY